MTRPRHQSATALMAHFTYDHLPASLAVVSKAFHDLAHKLYDSPGLDGPELTMALRKLLEAKDCAVRSARLVDSPPRMQGGHDAYPGQTTVDEMIEETS